MGILASISGAEAQSRTGDTRIFSPLLYRLSYLGVKVILVFPLVCCQAKCFMIYVCPPGLTKGTPAAHRGHSDGG